MLKITNRTYHDRYFTWLIIPGLIIPVASFLLVDLLPGFQSKAGQGEVVIQLGKIVLQVLISIVSTTLFLALAIIIAYILGRMTFEDHKLGPQRKKDIFVGLIYLPVWFVHLFIGAAWLNIFLTPGRGSSTDALVVVLSLFYALPATAAIYFLIKFLFRMKKAK